MGRCGLMAITDPILITVSCRESHYVELLQAQELHSSRTANSQTARSSFRKIRSGPADVAHDEWVGQVQAYSSDVTEEDFEQPRILWKIFKDSGEDKEFLHNLAGHLNKALPEVQKETISECLKHEACLPALVYSG
jgi:catalase